MAARQAMKGREPVKIRGAGDGLPDPHEAEALAAAAVAIQGQNSAENAAYACISAWIQTRARLAGSARLTDNLVFDLGNAQMRGFVEAALPAIAGAVVDTVDLRKSIFEMDKQDVVTLFVAGIGGAQEAFVAAGEAADFPFSDPIPF